jgi:hypothetical protein
MALTKNSSTINWGKISFEVICTLREWRPGGALRDSRGTEAYQPILPRKREATGNNQCEYPTGYNLKRKYLKIIGPVL